MQLTGQIIGILAVIPVVYGMSSKTRKSILKSQILGNTMIFVSYVLLGAVTACCISFLAIVRCIIFLFKEDRKWAQGKYWLYLFIAVTITSTAVTWRDIFSIFPLLGYLVFTLALWLKNPKHIRMVTVVSTLLWMPYDIINQAFGHLLIKTLECVSAVLGLIRHDRTKTQTKCG